MIQFDAPETKDLSGVMAMLKSELHNIESFSDSMMIRLLLLRFDQFDITNLFWETKTIFEVKPEIDWKLIWMLLIHFINLQRETTPDKYVQFEQIIFEFSHQLLEI